MQARAPKSVVIIVGTHLDQILQSHRDENVRRYKNLIEQCFSDQFCPDLPNYWPKIGGIFFVGLTQHKPYLNVDGLRDNIYNTALNLGLPIGMFASCV